MAKLTMVSRSIGDILTKEIDQVLGQFQLDIFKDKRQQQQLQQELNNYLPIGTWTVTVAGDNMTLQLVSRDKTNRAIWKFS